MNETKSRITVSRTSPDDVQQRQIIVELDGQPFSTLMYGQSASAGAAPGHHLLRVDNTWNKRQLEFDLAPGEHAKFWTVSRPGRLSWFLVAMLGFGPMYVSVEREP
jgi:hypothetical protein